MEGGDGGSGGCSCPTASAVATAGSSRWFGAASPFSKEEAGSSGVTFCASAWMLPLPPAKRGQRPQLRPARGTRIHPRDPPPAQDPHGCPSMPAYLAAGAGRRRSWTDGRRRLSRTPAGWGSDGSGAASPRWRRSGGVARGTGPAPSAPAASAAGRSTDPLPFHRLPCWRR